MFEKFKNQFNEELTSELNKRDERIKQLESDKVMLQKHIPEIKKQNVAKQTKIEELEQYGSGRGSALDLKVILMRSTTSFIKCCQK